MSGPWASEPDGGRSFFYSFVCKEIHHTHAEPVVPGEVPDSVLNTLNSGATLGMVSQLDPGQYAI
uniref:Uncharacterized protein n=1 Tax=Rhizophora mucronata TaxID=61149 RepID=A0A2P2NTV2_RHIMU